MSKEDGHRIITYLDDYYISTIYRQSSCPAAQDLWYYETMAWEKGKDGNIFGELIYQGSGLRDHARIVDLLLDGKSLYAMGDEMC